MRISTKAVGLTLTIAGYAVTASARILQQDLIDSALPADFHPRAATALGPDGFWASGSSGEDSLIVRYNADGTVRSVHYPPGAISADDYFLAALSDGGAVGMNTEFVSRPVPKSCVIRRYDAQARIAWSTRLGDACDGIYVDAADTVWFFLDGLSGGTLDAVDASGNLGNPRSLAQTAKRALGNPFGPGVFVAGSVADPSGQFARITKVDSSGVLWTASAPGADRNSQLLDIAVAADGSVWGFGSKGTQLYGMHVAANGVVLWTGAFDTSILPRAVRVAVRADGTVATVHADFVSQPDYVSGSGAEISAFDANNARIWHQSTGFQTGLYSCCSFGLAVAAPSNGDVFAALIYADDLGPHTSYLQQLRVDAAGAVRYAVPASATYAQGVIAGADAQLLADDSTLLIGNRFDHRAIDGTAMSSPSTQGITGTSASAHGAVYAADGSAYLVITDFDAPGFAVLGVDPAGAVRWRTAIAGAAGSFGDFGIMAPPLTLLRQDDVCVAGNFGGTEIVRCFALDDGHVTVSQDLATGLGNFFNVTNGGVTAANDVVLLFSSSQYDNIETNHAMIDSAGNLLHNVAPFGSSGLLRSVTSAQGVTFGIAAADQLLLQVAPDGTIVHQVALASSPGLLVPTADGGVYVASGATAQVFDADLSLRWQTTLPIAPQSAMQSQVLGTDVYITAYQNSAFGPIVPGTLLRQSLVDGAIAWSVPAPYVGGDFQIVADAADRQLVAFSTADQRTSIERFAFADGSSSGKISLPCTLDSCSVYRAALAEDITLRVARATMGYLTGSAFELTTLSNDADVLFADGFGD